MVELPTEIIDLILEYKWSHWKYIRMKKINESIIIRDFIRFMYKLCLHINI